MGIAPHCERLKNAHHDFMKVIKTAAPLYERFSRVHHGFMKALKMCISVALSLPKTCITIYEGLNNLRPL